MKFRVRAALFGLASLALTSAVPAIVGQDAQAAGGTVLRCHGKQATITAGDGQRVFRGTPGRDVIVGSSDADLIYARGGNDIVCAKGGEDVIFGGPGHDRLYGGMDLVGTDFDSGDAYAFGDKIVGGPGDDLINLGFDPGQSVPDLRYETRDTVSYVGSRRGVDLDLRAGRATGAGRDVLVVEPGHVAFLMTKHNDRVRGTSGGDWGHLGAGDDVFRGGGGNDLMSPGAGTDRLLGGAGDDSLGTNSGGDTLLGGPGSDLLTGHHPADYTKPRPRYVLRGGAGDDEIETWGTADGDQVMGGDGVDQLTAIMDARQPTDEVRANLAYGRLTVSGQTTMTDHFERYGLFVSTLLRIRGSDADDNIGFTARAGVIAHLHGGNDLLTWLAPWLWFHHDYGTDDTVDGGAGTDTVDLGEGVDTCTHVELGTC